MKKLLILFLSFSLSLSTMAQQPLVLTKVITKEGLSAQQLYDLSKNWSSKEFVASTQNSNDKAEILELSGKGRVNLTTNMLYSSIQGVIEYLIDIQCKDGRLRITMRDFTHRAANYAAFNNNMGILYDALPKNLSDIGIEGANRKACYKYYFKHGSQLCKSSFENACSSLESFLTSRHEDNQNW